MRKGTFYDKDFYLTEQQWSQLIGRFDVDKAKEYTDTFKIKVRCFCGGISCTQCPLGAFRTTAYNGCIRAIAGVLGRSNNWVFRLSLEEVHWWKSEDARARKQIQKIYNYLSGMKQVKCRASG